MAYARINLNALKAVSLFASKEETRYYLQGVNIEFYPDCVIYAATDGHRLFVYRDALPDGDERNTLSGNVIIPLAHCAPFKATTRALASDPYATLEGEPFEARKGAASSFKLAWQGTTIEFKPIDGTFPDWRRVLPPRDVASLEAPPAEVCFNFDYLASFAKAGAIVDALKPALIPNGADGPAWISFGPEAPCFGVIMPVRGRSQVIYNYDGKPNGLDLAPALPSTSWVDRAPAPAPEAVETVKEAAK
jgi:DNA polymerase-3 subunit beta